MHRLLTPACLVLLLACEKPALHALEDRIAALEDQGSEGEGDTGSDGDSELDQLSDQVDGLYVTVSELTTTTETLGTDLETTNEALSALQDQVDSLDADTASALEALSDSIDILNDDVDALDDQMADVVILLEEQSGAISALEDSVSALEDAISSIEAQEVAAAGTVVGLMSETIPDGYLACDGSSVLQTDYPYLYAVIGTQFGSEDSLSFNLPDLRGEFLRGVDGGVGSDLGAEDREDRGDGTTGDAVGTWQSEDIGAASYEISSDTVSVSTGCVSWSGDCQSVLSSTSLSSGEDEDAEVRPHNVSVVWVIKY